MGTSGRTFLTLAAVLLSLTSWPAVAGAGAPSSWLSKTYLQSVTCPSVQVCYVVGGRRRHNLIAASTDGGSTWTLLRNMRFEHIEVFSCSAVSRCSAVAYESRGPDKGWRLLSTTDGGHTWRLSPLPAGMAPPFALIGPALISPTCPSATTCYLLTAHSSQGSTAWYVKKTVDGGRTWSESRIASGGWLLGIWCSDASSCFAAGTGTTSGCNSAIVVIRTSDGGRTWRRHTVDCAARLDALACPTPAICYGIGSYGNSDAVPSLLIIGTTDGGVHWTDQLEDEGSPQLEVMSSGFIGAARRINCPSPAECFAVVPGGVLGTHDGGATWQVAETVPSGNFSDIACPDKATCIAVGSIVRPPHINGDPALVVRGMIVRTTDGGTTWTAE